MEQASSRKFRVYRRLCRGCQLRLHQNTTMESRVMPCGHCGAWFHGVYALRLLLITALALAALRLAGHASEQLIALAHKL